MEEIEKMHSKKYVNAQLDKISITGWIKNHEKLIELIESNKFVVKKLLSKSWRYDKSIVFQSSIIEEHSWTFHLSLEDGKEANKNRLSEGRIEFNPKYMVLEDMQELLKEMQEIFLAKKCTRLDVAIDFAMDILNTYQFHDKHIGREFKTFGKGSTLHSHYWGNSANNLYVLVIYDKLEQMQSSKYGDTMCKSDPNGQYQRCEARYCGSDSVDKLLNGTKNPWEDLILHNGLNIPLMYSELKEDAFLKLMEYHQNAHSFKDRYHRHTVSKFKKLYRKYLIPVELDIAKEFDIAKDGIITQYYAIMDMFR